MCESINSISVLGCGLMGSTIARKLVSSGVKTIGWNRTPVAAQKLEEHGVRPEISLEKAISASNCIFVVVSNYDVCKALFYPLLPLLAGKIVVNLTSGTCESANEFGGKLREEGVEYLDGSIWAMPGGIGTADACIALSGSIVAWQSVQKCLESLGGASQYVGAEIGTANVLEAAFPGTFYMTAILSFLEGIALCKAYGISEANIEQAIKPTLSLVRDGLATCVEKIKARDFLTDQATQQVHYEAAISYTLNTRSPVKNSPLTSALLQTLEQSCKSGRSHEDIASTVCQWVTQSPARPSNLQDT